MRLLLCLLLGFPPVTATAAELLGWKLVWADEFDRSGLPDPAKWSYEKGLVRNNEKQFFTVERLENARVEEGKLVIEARKESFDKADFTSASLITKGHAAWTYGRFEVRAKVPAARGTWPALWMMPLDYPAVPWPRCGEIDIMEHVGHSPGRIHGSLHTETFNHLTGSQQTSVISLPTATTEFHTYSIEWSKDLIIAQIDGKTYGTFDKKPTDTLAEWPFDKEFYLILNLAIGGNWGGQKGIEDSAFPQRLEVDFVRVYQKIP